MAKAAAASRNSLDASSWRRGRGVAGGGRGASGSERAGGGRIAFPGSPSDGSPSGGTGGHPTRRLAHPAPSEHRGAPRSKKHNRTHLGLALRLGVGRVHLARVVLVVAGRDERDGAKRVESVVEDRLKRGKREKGACHGELSELHSSGTELNVGALRTSSVANSKLPRGARPRSDAALII